jgi:hypothetical protein
MRMSTEASRLPAGGLGTRSRLRSDEVTRVRIPWKSTCRRLNASAVPSYRPSMSPIRAVRRLGQVGVRLIPRASGEADKERGERLKHLAQAFLRRAGSIPKARVRGSMLNTRECGHRTAATKRSPQKIAACAGQNPRSLIGRNKSVPIW